MQKNLNGESFAGLNFRGFDPYEVFRGNTFAVHWSGMYIVNYNILSRSSSKPRKFNPANLSPFNIPKFPLKYF